MTPRTRKRSSRALYVEIFIRVSLERLWELTQDPELHARWDARFSSIVPTFQDDRGAQHFRYELALGRIHTIRGTGVSLGDRLGPSGTRTSALVFDTDDWVSPLGKGRGYWKYHPHTQDGQEGVIFITGYEYAPGWGIVGRVLDLVITRRFIWWLTAWSFDRLRLWAEDGIPPEQVRPWKGWFGGVRASAKHCRSRSETDVMASAPETLGRIDL